MNYASHTKALARELKRLKKDLGASNVRQGYKGTGSKAHKRQIWIRTSQGVIDLWLEGAVVGMGGVVGTSLPPIACTVEGVLREPSAVYDDILAALKECTNL